MTERTTTFLACEGGVRLAVDLVSAVSAPQPLGFLLVHGLASNARLWDGVADSLAAAGYPSAAVDLRGHGRSDKPDDGYDYDTLSADLRAVMATLAAGRGDPGSSDRRIVAVGQSFGGNLVLEFAARESRSLGSALVGVACVDGGTFDLRSRFATFDEAVTALAPPQLVGTAATHLEARLRAMHPDWPQAGIAASMANFEVRADGTVAPWLTLERHLAILRTMWGSRPHDLYAVIRIPVLFLPADSPGSPEWTAEKRAGVEEALSSLADATARWFSPADHDIHAQHPGEVAAALVDRFGPLARSSPA